MKKYTYNDWYSGKVRLDTCSAVFPKAMQADQTVSINSFSDKDILKIKVTQKEIFETKKDYYLKRFLDEFISRSRNSKQKVAYLKSEQFKYRSILIGNEFIELEKHYEIIGTNLYYSGRDLYMYREYYKNIVVNGQERDYSFINSPKYPYQNDDIQPREIFAQAMIEYLNFLAEFVSSQTNKAEEKKREHEFYKNIFNSSIEYCKSIEEFQQNLQIDMETLDRKELLIKLRDYKINYSKAVEHYKKYGKNDVESKIYQNIFDNVNAALKKYLNDKSEGDSKQETGMTSNFDENKTKDFVNKLSKEKTFEDYLINIDIKKIQKLIDDCKNSGPEYIAVLIFALGNKIEHTKIKMTDLYLSLKNSFQVSFTYQAFTYQMRQCNNNSQSKEKSIQLMKKQILDLTIK